MSDSGNLSPAMAKLAEEIVSHGIDADEVLRLRKEVFGDGIVRRIVGAEIRAQETLRGVARFGDKTAGHRIQLGQVHIASADHAIVERAGGVQPNGTDIPQIMANQAGAASGLTIAHSEEPDGSHARAIASENQPVSLRAPTQKIVSLSRISNQHINITRSTVNHCYIRIPLANFLRSINHLHNRIPMTGT